MATNGVQWIWECLTQEKVEALPIMICAYEMVQQKSPHAKEALDLLRATVECLDPRPTPLLSLQFIDLLNVKLAK